MVKWLMMQFLTIYKLLVFNRTTLVLNYYTLHIHLMEHHIKEKNIEYYNYDEFTNIEELGVELVNKVYKANWKHGKLIALKSINLTDEIIKEVVREVKIQQENDLNNAMIKLYGITSKTNSGI
uniref:Uncharacterized protein n=1 Tax=Rhizophagus irregularis (strain DAOM 181602 / DAOM 197198 / MUCL 43194) TaxID=747089 RepID=U9UHX5_RHIID